MRLEMRPESPALYAEQFHVPYQRRYELDLLDGTPESPQEHCHKSSGMLKSLKQREIAPCTPDQLEMRPDSFALAPELSRLPHQTRQVA